MKNKKTEQKRKNNLYFYIIPFLLLLVLAVLLTYLHSVRGEIKKISLPKSVIGLINKPGGYPVLASVYEPYLTSEAAIVMENESKKILYAKNPNVRFSTASTAKIMSALVALEYFDFNDILVVPNQSFEGTVVGFYPGENLYFDDLLYSMMLASGNDAAYIIAANYPGGLKKFIERMNEKTKELKLYNTHFGDPAGLLDDENYSTPYDLARLSSFALENQVLSRVVSTKRRVFTDVEGRSYYEIDNLNRLLGESGVIGVKTGQTLGAGEVLATGRSEDGKIYIIVVMKSEDRFADTLSLINLISGNVEYLKPIIPE